MNRPSLLELARIVEFGEADGYLEMFEAAASLGLRTERIGGAAVMVAPGFEGTFLNQVIGLGLKQAVDPAIVADIAAVYRDAQTSRYGLGVSPAVEPAPAEVHEMLGVHGIVPVNRQAKLFRRPVGLAHVDTDLRIEEIGVAQVASFSAIAVSVFGMSQPTRGVFEACVGRPGWRYYLAYDGDQPVATGFVYIANGIAWLGSGATLPEYRRRGAQGAIMARRVNDSIAEGCRWLIVETVEDTPQAPNSSYHNMLRTGFELAYLREDYICRNPQAG